MRDPMTYGGARRNQARVIMAALKAQGQPRNWRLVRASLQAAPAMFRRAKALEPRPAEDA